ncbi:MAG: motility associated factor glycosyltransferase family protein [Phycisphaerales bacterium]|nr:motility associated factor glycosyltransferase family protein [Phycisphaerales bacterium]
MSLPETPAPSRAVLERNLEAIGRLSPDTAAGIAATAPRADLDFELAPDGGLTAKVRELGRSRSLASAKRPISEGERLAEGVDLDACGAVVVMGFGLGHHVRALAERLREFGALIVFEPDLGLLRAVLERVDCSEWILKARLVIATDPDDHAGLASKLSGLDALIALGLTIVEHPPSLPRLGPAATAFGQTVTGVVRSVRTTVTTTLVQVEPTLRNLLMNLDHYTGCQGIGELAGTKAGTPAVVVSAGPSLRRNLDLLAEPGVRDRVTIIAVQTVLKPMLERGIKPHYVVALDHHEISRRFYEGLTPEAVEGVTLVVEPKANPAILDAFPGEIRVAQDDRLDTLLGEHAPERAPIRPGATVAHLAYYFARHLGCDPVILIGQDLGFTDGQYYAAGAAIHEVWAAELNEFRTLEMLEWERIARAKSVLHRTTDVYGRAIFTDDQMHSYLVQFQADFLEDAKRGLRVIDATEGGVKKQHTEAVTLQAALEAWALGAGRGARGVTDDASTEALQPNAAEGRSHASAQHPAPSAHSPIIDRVRRVQRDARTLSTRSREASRLLAKAKDETEPRKINELVHKVHAIREEVEKLGPAFDLTMYIAQTAALNRLKADRKIGLAGELTEMEEHRLRTERDMKNVSWIAEAAEHLAIMLHDAADCLAGGPKITRDASPREKGKRSGGLRSRVAAVVFADTKVSGLGVRRDLLEPSIMGRSALDWTLQRLGGCKTLRRVIVLTDDPSKVSAAIGDAPSRLRISVVRPARRQHSSRLASTRVSRLFAPSCWRGSLGGLTVYDEALDAQAAADALEEAGFDSGVLVGGDWAAVDPELIDDLVRRHHESPEQHRVVFSQAAPGLSGIFCDAALLRELAEQGDRGGVFASIGGVLGYTPRLARPDPIAKPWCVQIPPELRDLHARAIPDSPARVAHLLRAIEPMGPEWFRLPVRALVDALARTRDEVRGFGPRSIELDLTDDASRRYTPIWIDALENAHPDATLTLRADGESLERAIAAAGEAKAKGIAGVHLRTGELSEDPGPLLESGVDVVSLDLVARTHESYRALTGRDGLTDLLRRTQSLVNRARDAEAPGRPTVPWIVPRLTRRDAVRDEIEGFYDHWLAAVGCCVIDPLPEAIPGERIEPLPVPSRAAVRFASEKLIVTSELTPDAVWPSMETAPARKAG